MKLDNVERVELFNFTIERIGVLKRINTTKLKDLLISTNYMGKNFWRGLDSALVALRSRMGSHLNFYLISDSDKFTLNPKLFKNCWNEGVILDKSVVERSMRWMGSHLHGSGKRYQPLDPDHGVTK